MKVLVFDIKRFAVHDGPGIRTTVFLKGCPLHCMWCHNPESQSPDPVTVNVKRKLNGSSITSKKIYGKRMEVDEVVSVLLRDRVYYEESGGGITFSGGEPMGQLEGLVSLLEFCRDNNLHTAVDTSGFASREQFLKVLDLADLFLYDLKNMDGSLHLKNTGVDNKLILSNAELLLEKGARVIFRIPVIPGINTMEEEISRYVEYLRERRRYLEEIHLLPYHNIARNKYARLGIEERMPEAVEPAPDFLDDLTKQFKKTGLRVLSGG